MDDRNDINKFRKKQSARRFLLRVGILVLLVLAVMLVAVNKDKIFSPLKDAALDVGEGGFPLMLPGSTEYTPHQLGDGFCLLTDTYIYTYNTEGALISGIQHGLQNPELSCSGKRALVYDRTGKDIKLYSRTGELFGTALPDRIDFAQIGSRERCAVVTKSTKYSNCLYVFNDEGKQLFRWASPAQLIDRVVFSPDEKSLFAAVCGSNGGQLEYKILRFDLDNAEGSVWQTHIGEHMIISLQYTDSGIFAVSKGGMTLLSAETGEITAEGSYIRQAEAVPSDGKLFSLLLKDSGTASVLSVYDKELNASAAVTLEQVSAVKAADGGIYVLTDRELAKYSGSLELVQSYPLTDAYSDMIVFGGAAYLLGYNTVDKLEL